MGTLKTSQGGIRKVFAKIKYFFLTCLKAGDGKHFQQVGEIPSQVEFEK